jgi:hypothetical protein
MIQGVAVVNSVPVSCGLVGPEGGFSTAIAARDLVDQSQSSDLKYGCEKARKR